jgi:hypothetical protein
MENKTSMIKPLMIGFAVVLDHGKNIVTHIISQKLMPQVKIIFQIS